MSPFRIEILNIIKNAKAKIQNPENWTKEFYIITKDDVVIDHVSHSTLKTLNINECRMCAIGALRVAAVELVDKDHVFYYDSAISHAGNIVIFGYDSESFDVEEFNDSDNTSHEDIMQFFDQLQNKVESNCVLLGENLLSSVA